MFSSRQSSFKEDTSVFSSDCSVLNTEHYFSFSGVSEKEIDLSVSFSHYPVFSSRCSVLNSDHSVFKIDGSVSFIETYELKNGRQIHKNELRIRSANRPACSREA
jgi:hypothetical protein